jgi:hypothetical protein
VGVSLLPETLPRIREIGLDWPVVGFALGLALLTGLLCGLAPAFAAIRTSVNETLKDRRTHGHLGQRPCTDCVRRWWLRKSPWRSVLLTASGLCCAASRRCDAVDIGFVPDHTLAAVYVLPETAVCNANRRSTHSANELLQNLRQLPGVEALRASLRCCPPPAMTSGIAFTIDGYVPPKGAGLNMAAMSLVRGDPFQALGIRSAAGPFVYRGG